MIALRNANSSAPGGAAPMPVPVVPPDLVLGVLSYGGAVAYEATRASAGIEEGEPPASMRGALGGP